MITSRYEKYNKVAKDEYKNLLNESKILKFPMMIRNNGLLNFLGYLENEKISEENKKKFIKLFFDLIFKEIELNEKEKNIKKIVNNLLKCSSEQYRLLTQETYEFAVVLAMYYKAYKEGK